MDDRLRARYGTLAAAAAYRTKYDRTAWRRWSARREKALVLGFLERAGTEGQVLDVPCAAGRMVPTLLAHAAKVVGADLSAPMVAVATEALAPDVAAGRVVFSVASAEALPFADGAFDTVLCWRLLHHLPDRALRVRILSEVRRVLRRAAVVSYADRGTLKSRIERMRRKERRCFLHSAAGFAEEAAEAGLTVVAAERLSSAFSLLAGALLVPGANPAGRPAGTRPS